MLCLLSLSPTESFAQRVIIYGEATYKPYSWVENGEFKGLYIDILQRVFQQMKDYQVTLKAVPWERGLHLLEVGKGFALFPPHYHPARRPYMSPYSFPLFMEKTILVCNKSVASKHREKWPDDYMGLTIGQSSGYLLGGEAFFEAVEQEKIFISDSLRAGQNLLMVASGRIDCYINDELVINEELMMLNSNKNYIKTLEKLDSGRVVAFKESYLGFTNVNEENFPYKADFVKQFNHILKEMTDSGEVEAIAAKYLQK